MHEIIITREYLRANPNHVLVFGDNLLRKGKGGGAKLRDEPNTYGFITKKAPNNKISSFYNIKEYISVFNDELFKLMKEILDNQHTTYLISRIGGGLANEFGIFELIIDPMIRTQLRYNNVIFLWNSPDPFNVCDIKCDGKIKPKHRDDESDFID